MSKSNLRTNCFIRFFLSWPVLSLLSSILLVLTFPTPGVSFIGWFALVPFFLIIIREKLSKVIISAVILNFIFNFFYLIWLKEYKQPLTLPLSLIAELIYLIPQAIIAWLVVRITPFYFRALALTTIWIFFDYLKTIGFLAFPWGILGYTQYKNIYLIQLSSIFGIWGVDFVILFFNIMLAIVIDKLLENKEFLLSLRNIDSIYFFISIILIIVSIIYGVITVKNNRYSGNKLIKLSLIQANFDPWDPNLNDNLSKEFNLTEKSLNYNPDMIIWSESSVPFPFDYYLKKKNSYAVKIDSFIKSLNKPFIFGSLSFNGIYRNGKFIGDFYNVAYYYKPGEGYSCYRKIHLVPFGEWFPYKKLFPFAERILEKAGAGNFKPGNKYNIFQNKDLYFNILICFEDVFGNLTRKFIKNGSRMIINVTNDAWSGYEKAEIQHFSISIFRAIENRVPLIRVANGGVTAYIDPYGRVVSELPLFKSKYLICNVRYSDTQNKKDLTFYTKYGDILPFFLLLTLFFILFIKLVIKIVDIIPNINNM